MADLPAGIITFLFTDIEGSTRLLQQLGESYAALLARHQQIIRQACEKFDGFVVSIQGDSFFAVFPGAMDAINAAVESQRALTDEPWVDGVQVRVRMGLHTGEARLSEANYVGIDVHRAARIAAAAHGGQVLLSQTTFNLVENDLPEGVAIRDLGEHRLKDLRHPKHLYQLVIQGLQSDFPALKSLGHAPNNLPARLTSFIGREEEIAEVKQLLSRERLLTITGPGGCGKTRLALEIASEMLDQFQDGIFFIDLAPVTDPGLVASAIAQTLDITEVAGQSIEKRLIDYVHGKSILLVLDNFEQVIPAASFIAGLLAASDLLKILVTSREDLRIGGEQKYPLMPLGLPDLSQTLSHESLSKSAAVQLFVQRACLVLPNFAITEDTAQAIAQICYRLDGLPLAIELAAARIRLLPPQAMLARLDHRLDFLTGGRRDQPARQQTLRNAIAWSYDLLDEHDQKLFRQLSVFVGGLTLDAAGAVVAENLSQLSVLNQLESLLDKSLLREMEGLDGETRFTMLEMLREFGLEQLIASGDGGIVRRRHAIYFITLVGKVSTKLESPEQVQWMRRMRQEHDNLRAALEWSKNAQDSGDICMQLAGALGFFWESSGYYSEGRRQLAAILDLPFAMPRTAARAGLLARAAELAYRQSDYPATSAYAVESLAICRELGDRPGTASALLKLANSATEVGDNRTASGYLIEALGIWRELEDQHGIARALISLGWVALRSGDYPLASARLQESLAISRQLGDTRSMGFELSGLGEVALRQGDYKRASNLVEESLQLRRQLGNKWGVGVSLGILGLIALREENWELASAWLCESLEVRQEIGDKSGCAWCLERLAEVDLAQGQPERAAHLLGAAETLRQSIGSVIDPVDWPEYEKTRSWLISELGEPRTAELWGEGQALSLEQVLESLRM